MSDELFAQGQAALKAGDKQKARQIFQSIVQKDPQNENAWLWLAGSTEINFERALYLERALEINPGNAPARRELDKVRTAMLAHTPAPVTRSSVTAAQPVPAAIVPQMASKASKKAKKLTVGRIVYLGLLAIVSVLAAVVVIIWLAGWIPTIGNGGNSGDNIQKGPVTIPKSPVTYSVKYEITGSARSVSVTMTNVQGGTEQGNYKLPYEKKLIMQKNDFAYISAQNDDESGSVICRIWVNDKIWKESKSAGAFVIADCSGLIGTE